MEGYPEVPVGSYPVNITRLINPGCFWGHKRKTQHNFETWEKIELLEMEMTKLFSHRKFVEHHPTPGEIVAVFNPATNCWSRGCVETWCAGKIDKVLLVDYGKHLSGVSCVYELPDFAREPEYQAMQMFLYGILPVSNTFDYTIGSFVQSVDEEWMETASQRAMNYVDESKYCYFSVKKKYNGAYLGDVYFIHGSNEKVIKLSDLFCTLNLAVFDYNRFMSELNSRVDKFLPAIKLKDFESLVMGDFQGAAAKNCPSATSTEPKIQYLPAGRLLPVQVKKSLRNDSIDNDNSNSKAYSQQNSLSECNEGVFEPRQNHSGTSSNGSRGDYDPRSRGAYSKRSPNDTHGGSARGSYVNSRGGYANYSERGHGNRSPREYNLESAGRGSSTNKSPRKNRPSNFPDNATREHTSRGANDNLRGNGNFSGGSFMPRRDGDDIPGIQRLNQSRYAINKNTNAQIPRNTMQETDQQSCSSSRSSSSQGSFKPSLMQDVHYLSLPVLVQGCTLAKPIDGLSKASLNTNVSAQLRRMKCTALTNLQKHMLPAISRGQNIVAVGSGDSGKSTGFIIPLASSVLDDSLYKELKLCKGPIVLVLCTDFEKATLTEKWFKVLTNNEIKDHEHHYRHNFNKGKEHKVRVLLTYGGGAEKEKLWDMFNGCDVLISTPPCLLRMISFMEEVLSKFDRLCHIVFDDADVLFETFTPEVRKILEICQKSLKSKERGGRALQAICTARHWNEALSQFTTKVMTDPTIIINSGFEVLAYCKIPIQIETVVAMDNKTAVTLDTLKNVMKTPGKIVVTCAYDFEPKELARAFQPHVDNLIFTHADCNMAYLIGIKAQWDAYSRESNPVLIVSDTFLMELQLYDADTVIHYTAPDKRVAFNTRIATIIKQCPNKLDDKESNASKPNVILIMSTPENMIESEEKMLRTLMEFFRRTKASIPEGYENQEKIVLEKRERENANSPFCDNLCNFGECKTRGVCPRRHGILQELDQSPSYVPISGEVKMRILDVNSATHFSALLEEHTSPDGTVQNLKTHDHVYLPIDINDHFSIPSNSEKEEKELEDELLQMDVNEEDLDFDFDVPLDETEEASQTISAQMPMLVSSQKQLSPTQTEQLIAPQTVKLLNTEHLIAPQIEQLSPPKTVQLSPPKAHDPNKNNDLLKHSSPPVNTKLKLVMKLGDLLACPQQYSLAHCIAEDFVMTRGISKQIRDKFGQIDLLKSQQKKTGQVAYIKSMNRCVFYLLIKEYSNFDCRAKLNDLQSCLLELKNLCLQFGIKNLAIPKIGAGAIHLEWEDVKACIEDVFYNVDITISVYYLVIKELEGDIFHCPAHFSLAHCVARDFSMTKGLAREFLKKFGKQDYLKAQNKQLGQVAVLAHRQRYLFYMVTKTESKFYCKPNLSTFEKSVKALKDECVKLNVKHLAIPRIGTGIDKLRWNDVKKILENTFDGSGIEINVYNYTESSQQKRQKVNNCDNRSDNFTGSQNGRQSNGRRYQKYDDGSSVSSLEFTEKSPKKKKVQGLCESSETNFSVTQKFSGQSGSRKVQTANEFGEPSSLQFQVTQNIDHSSVRKFQNSWECRKPSGRGISFNNNKSYQDHKTSGGRFLKVNDEYSGMTSLQQTQSRSQEPSELEKSNDADLVEGLNFTIANISERIESPELMTVQETIEITIDNEHSAESEEQPVRTSVNEALMRTPFGFYMQKRMLSQEAIFVGAICAVMTLNNLYQRVRIEVKTVDSKGKCISAQVRSIDEGWRRTYDHFELFYLPEGLQRRLPQAVDIHLTRLLPNDNDPTWNYAVNKYVVGWLSEIKENHKNGYYAYGKIVLSFGGRLWVDPLECRQYLENMKAPCIIFSLRSRILGHELATNNPSHLQNLYQLCTNAGLKIPDYANLPRGKKLNLPIRLSDETLKPSWAFLPSEFDTINLACVETPSSFFIQRRKNLDLLEHLQDEICNYENSLKGKARRNFNKTPGSYVLAIGPDNTWSRAVIREVEDVVNNVTLIHFVDFGDTAHSNSKSMIPMSDKIISKLPFQMIECTLAGIKPTDGKCWSVEAGDYLAEVLLDGDGCTKPSLVQQVSKTESRVTGGWRYAIKLYDVVSHIFVNEQMVKEGHAVWEDNYTPEEDINWEKLDEVFSQNLNPRKQKGSNVVVLTMDDLSEDECCIPDSDNNISYYPEASDQFADAESSSPNKAVKCDKSKSLRDSDSDESFVSATDNQDGICDEELDRSINYEDYDSDDCWDFLEAMQHMDPRFKLLYSLASRNKKQELLAIEQPAEENKESTNDKSLNDSCITASQESMNESATIIPMKETPLIMTAYEPTVSWKQDDEWVTLKVILPAVDKYDVNISTAYIDFTTCSDGRIYFFSKSLFGYVDPELSSHEAKGLYVEIKLCKLAYYPWPRLERPSGLMSHKTVVDADAVHADSDSDEDHILNWRSEKWATKYKMGKTRIPKRNDETVLHNLSDTDSGDEEDDVAQMMTRTYDPCDPLN